MACMFSATFLVAEQKIVCIHIWWNNATLRLSWGSLETLGCSDVSLQEPVIPVWICASEGQAVDHSHTQSHSAGGTDTPRSATLALPAPCHTRNFSHEFHYFMGTDSDSLCLIRLTVGGWWGGWGPTASMLWVWRLEMLHQCASWQQVETHKRM